MYAAKTKALISCQADLRLCFLICKKQVYLRSPYLIIISLLLALFATFQKAGTCLDDQQSMAKQPIKG